MWPRWESHPDVRRGRHVIHHLHAHVVFVTRYRRGVFNDAMLTRCEEIMRKACEDFEADLIEFNGEEDHVHLLIHYPPKVALSNLVNSLKGVSSRRLRQEFTGRANRAITHGRFWSGSYFAGSCGGAPLALVNDYIENQKRPDSARAAGGT
ncbi:MULTISPECIES: IS200/IS605 family transposase [Streptomyces]|uniref:IS200/IS605 family transposase n=1 Tax=Streptomyces TaxID=1883 RepID=UPI001907714D|nr:IS200/IS605 family transposase [Streptomyces sp. XC 2026]QQN77485.1 IS200/IS605 family transposase [Streptomyces sp. XC 2026]